MHGELHALLPRAVRLTAALIAAVSVCWSTAAAAPPTAADWRIHLENDLMRFWMAPSALGAPPGNFPSVRCNDGTLINYAAPCPEANHPYLLSRVTTAVALSRQTYGYCMAFHMTGKRQYLLNAQAGVNYLRAYVIDRVNGGARTSRDDLTGQWDSDPALRTSQEIAYALLGLSCYARVTRDPTVRADVEAVKNYLFSKYYDPALGYIKWRLGGAAANDAYLAAQLDMLPFILFILPDLSARQQAAWRNDVSLLADIMIRRFYSPSERLFFPFSNTPADLDLAQSPTDFGLNAKANWNLRAIGRITGRQDLINFADAHAQPLFNRAFMPAQGTWASGLEAGGALIGEKTWWMHAELDQLAAVLSLQNASYAWYLDQSYAYWLRVFVDRQYGEVWTSIAAESDQPVGFPKAWFWKNAFHSVEHAYFAYMTSSQKQGTPATVYYALRSAPSKSSLQPAMFVGRLSGLTSSADPTFGRIYAASFRNIAH